MKTANDIVKEIKDRGSINTEEYMVDESWEEYMRNNSQPTDDHETLKKKEKVLEVNNGTAT